MMNLLHVAVVHMVVVHVVVLQGVVVHVAVVQVAIVHVLVGVRHMCNRHLRLHGTSWNYDVMNISRFRVKVMVIFYVLCLVYLVVEFHTLCNGVGHLGCQLDV
jgi:hypothetical protein